LPPEPLELTDDSPGWALLVFTAGEVVAAELVVGFSSFGMWLAATRIECATATLALLCPRRRLMRRYWACR
jgi:hypothetical protein